MRSESKTAFASSICAELVPRSLLNELSALTDQGLAEVVSRIATVYASFRAYLLDDEIKQAAAEPFPTVIGTLDALHLACARRCAKQYPGETLLVYSYDKQMNLCARATGLSTPLDEE
jgi:hypothetical protein